MPSFSATDLLSAALQAGLVCAATCVLIVVTKALHGHLSFDSTSGPQKFHKAPTPRIGGVALLAGLIAGWVFLPHASRTLLGQLLLAGLPVFVAGIAEDITKRVGVRERLAAAMFGGLLATLLTGYSLQRVDMPGFDQLLSWSPFAMVFTAFCVAGVANAVNIIDGFHGLASGVVLLAVLTMGFIGARVGDYEYLQLCLVVAGATGGFMLLNFPLGKIFLGDAGAYLLGFLLAWLAVLLPVRNPEVSAWASLAICAYPILEVFFSFKRKYARKNCAPHKPDSVHLHMLLFRRASGRLLARPRSAAANALTSVLLWPFALLGCAAAVLLYRQKELLMGVFLILALAYHIVYMRLIHFRWCLVWNAQTSRLVSLSPES